MDRDKVSILRNKYRPNHRQARRTTKATLRKWDFNEWFRYLDFITGGEPKPEGWWTG